MTIYKKYINRFYIISFSWVINTYNIIFTTNQITFYSFTICNWLTDYEFSCIIIYNKAHKSQWFTPLA